MSLLTDEEIGDLLDLEKEKEYPCSVGSVSTVDVDAVVDASQTATLKAVAELVNSRLNCDDLMKLAELLTNPLTPASSVKVTVELTALELRMLELGKMPGEE